MRKQIKIISDEEMDIKKQIAQSIAVGFTEEIEGALCVAPNGMGDFALPCFKFSKELKKAPAVIASELAAKVTTGGIIDRVEVAGAYLNFFLNRGAYAAAVLEEIFEKGVSVGSSDIGAGKTICIDYSSVNIAKKFHMGHLSTTVIGGALCNIMRKLNYKVIGVNHLGDYGTQFGQVVAAYSLWGDKDKPIDIEDLLELYARFNREAEQNPELNDLARAKFVAIEQKEPEALAIFEAFKAVTLSYAQKIYDLLGVHFEDYNGESFFSDKIQPVINILEQKNLLKISDGATVVDTGDPTPCMLFKSDGSTLYATRDLAAAYYRYNQYKFDKYLYVVAYQQNLHFQQLFKLFELMELPFAGDMEHVRYGMVSLPEGSMSTRGGRMVFLEDVLEQAQAKTLQIIEQKSPDLENKEQIAQNIGVGAVIFSALSNGRIKDIVFSYDSVLNFEGETAPYLCYTHARCASVLNKGGFELNAKTDFSSLTLDEEFAIVKELNRFSEVVLDAAQKYEPSIISRYLIDLAQAFNKFYFEHKIANNAARLALTWAVKTILKSGMELILIKAPERM